MKKVLVFGGAFNPPTIAHIDLAYEAMKTLRYDGVVFVPTKSTYIEDTQHKDMAFSNEERLSFLNAIAQNRDWMEVCDYEIVSRKQPRTYETLCYLKTKGYDCKLLFGFDKLIELETGWRYVPEILKEFGAVCFNRNGSDAMHYIRNDAYLKQFEPYITVLDAPVRYQAVSSSTVRQTLLKIGQSAEELREGLPDELVNLLLERILG